MKPTSKELMALIYYLDAVDDRLSMTDDHLRTLDAELVRDRDPLCDADHIATMSRLFECIRDQSVQVRTEMNRWRKELHIERGTSIDPDSIDREKLGELVIHVITDLQQPVSIVHSEAPAEAIQ